MKLPPVVSAEEWQAARDALLVKEKEATHARDALAAERRRLPRVHIAKEYVVYNNPNVNNDDLAEEMVRMLVRVRRHLPKRR